MTYLISDIHGTANRFLDILGQAGFSDRDEMYILGDAIDRGPDGIVLLEYIMARGNMHMILGNHEEMMLESLGKRPAERPDMADIWNRNGSNPTWQAFRRLKPGRQDRLLEWLNGLPDGLEISVGGKDYLLVHASPSEDRHDRLWERINPISFSPPEGKTVIFGHTPVCFMHMITDKYLRKCGAHMNIDRGHGWIDIDCGNALRNMRQACLGCLRLDDMAEFYSTA